MTSLIVVTAEELESLRSMRRWFLVGWLMWFMTALMLIYAVALTCVQRRTYKDSIEELKTMKVEILQVQREQQETQERQTAIELHFAQVFERQNKLAGLVISMYEVAVDKRTPIAVAVGATRRAP